MRALLDLPRASLACEPPRAPAWPLIPAAAMRMLILLQATLTEEVDGLPAAFAAVRRDCRAISLAASCCRAADSPLRCLMFVPLLAPINIARALAGSWVGTMRSVRTTTWELVVERLLRRQAIFILWIGRYCWSTCFDSRCRPGQAALA